MICLRRSPLPLLWLSLTHVFIFLFCGQGRALGGLLGPSAFSSTPLPDCSSPLRNLVVLLLLSVFFILNISQEEMYTPYHGKQAKFLSQASCISIHIASDTFHISKTALSSYASGPWTLLLSWPGMPSPLPCTHFSTHNFITHSINFFKKHNCNWSNSIHAIICSICQLNFYEISNYFEALDCLKH